MKPYFWFLISTILVGALLLATPAKADAANLNFVSVATGIDDGPQDGVFDAFTTPNLGSINNNGYTSFRTAFEFSMSSIPPGSTISSANLTMQLLNFEGTRAIEVHGYAGDGSVQLSDFAFNALVGTTSVGPSGSQTLIFDVTDFMANLVADGETFAGFNVREEPANPSNFTIMNLEGLSSFTILSVEFSGPVTPYNFSGFFQPVDNLPTLNLLKAGSAVPVKFSLSGDQGLDIFESGYPKSQAIDCDSSMLVDGVEETVTAGSSSLSYDASADTYTYVWKTDKGWANTCRQLVLKLDDGTYHRANFNFTK